MSDPRLITLAAFVKRRVRGARHTDRTTLLAWLTWYWRDGRVGVVREHGRIVAVALARCVNDPAEAQEPFFHDDGGKIVWVDDIVSLHPHGIPALIELVVRRFGPREALAGHVLNRDGELRMLPWKLVVRFFNGGISHGLTEHSSSTGRA